MGISDDNWPATVGIFAGIFAKEVVVGTLDALYSETQYAIQTSICSTNSLVPRNHSRKSLGHCFNRKGPSRFGFR
ncbi:MAG: hypothetical protein CM1200mP9_11990 [Gammaproteobacteria bacterium]|nr:MAG: hypothetical protein CM1200mP9_11990 [Gammaproteobacteria bacterium]